MNTRNRGFLNGVRAGVAGLALIAAGGVAHAQTAEQAIAFRKGVMQVQQWHLTPLVQMVKNARPYDAALVARNAAILEASSRMTVEGFVAGTETGTTRALPAVWKDAAGLKTASERFQAEAAKLVAVAKGGDEKAVRAQIGEVFRSCVSCHDNFRAK